MFDFAQSKLLPDQVITDDSVTDIKLDNVSASGITYTTSDNKTFDITDLSGGIFLAYSNTNVLDLNENVAADWISENLIVNSYSVAVPDALTLYLGFVNQNFDPANPSENAAWIVQINGDGAPADAESGQYLSFDDGGTGGNAQFLAQISDLSSFDITDIELVASLKRDGTDFNGSGKLDSNGDNCNGYINKDLNTWLDFTEAYPAVLAVNLLGAAEAMNFTFQYGVSDLNFAKPSTATLTGKVIDDYNPAVCIPPAQTGQRTNYTPAGRTSQDDGGTQAGRLNKTSTFESNAASATQGTVYSGALTSGPYNGTTSITFGSQSLPIENRCAYIPRLALMINPGAFNQGLQFAWDDTTGTNDDIFAYCDAANAASLSGHDDWRVANLMEVMSVLNFHDFSGGNSVMYPDRNFVALPVGDSILTSTTHIANSNQAYEVNDDGQVTTVSKTLKNSNHYPLLVRDVTQDCKI